MIASSITTTLRLSLQRNFSWNSRCSTTSRFLSNPTSNVPIQSDAKENNVPPLIAKSKWTLGSVGVLSSLIDDLTLRSIRQLPECEDVLMAPPSSEREKQEAINKVSRAIDVFRGLNPGDVEHMACLGMLAEISGVAGSDESESILDTMLADVANKEGGHGRAAVLIAKAKSLYYKGEFMASRTICNELLEEDLNNQSFGTVQAARTILGASRLQAMETIDDAFSVRDPFRMVVKYVEHNRPSNKLALAAAQYNLGTAEAIYAAAVSKFNNVSVPMDSALRCWKQGSTKIADRKPYSILKARCHTNISWVLIEMANETGNMDYLKQASENAQTALACYKDSTIKDGLSRTLCLLGICAHKNGQAVTAQGLFASALSYEQDTIVGKLSHIESLNSYAKLCDDWDKRGDEAESMREKAKSLLLPFGWRHSTTTAGSLWLFGL